MKIDKKILEKFNSVKIYEYVESQSRNMYSSSPTTHTPTVKEDEVITMHSKNAPNNQIIVESDFYNENETLLFTKFSGSKHDKNLDFVFLSLNKSIVTYITDK